MYKKVDSEILAQLHAIVGGDNVIVDGEALEPSRTMRPWACGRIPRWW